MKKGQKKKKCALEYMISHWSVLIIDYYSLNEMLNVLINYCDVEKLNYFA